MASMLSTVATVAGIGGIVAELLGGGSTVTLGGVTFREFDMPASMPVSVRQRIVKQTLPGGIVIANMIGPEWPPISWKGIFLGPSAAKSVKQLYTMTKAGLPLPLTFLDQTFVVAIASFSAKAKTSAYYDYQITCEVLADSSQINGPPAPPSLGQQILGNINAALGFDVVDAAGQAADVLSKVQLAAGVAGALVPGSSAFMGLASAAGIASGVVGSAIPLAETAISGLGSVASGAGAAVNWLTGATAQTGNLANATAASGYVGAAKSNIAVDDGTA